MLSATKDLFELASTATFFREFLWSLSHDASEILSSEEADDEKKRLLCEAFVKRYSEIGEEMGLLIKYKYGMDSGHPGVMGKAAAEMKKILDTRRARDESK